MINRASEGTCRQCGRRILWVRMKSGKNMPVDMALHNYKKDSTGKEKNRNFQVGDVLILKEWDNIKYSGREIGAVVRYVLRDFIGLQEGYVALGLQILS